jgi:hypothetical protein
MHGKRCRTLDIPGTPGRFRWGMLTAEPVGYSAPAEPPSARRIPLSGGGDRFLRSAEPVREDQYDPHAEAYDRRKGDSSA